MSEADKAVDSFLLELSAPAPKVSSKFAEIEKRKKALAALKEKPVPVTSDISDSEKRLKELEHETSTFSINDSSSGSSSSSRSAKMEELKRRKAETEARIRSVSEGKITYVPATGTSARISGLEVEKERYRRELSDLPSTKELLAEKESATDKLDRLQRGIDVCFLMDCTGSMGSFIAAAKDKILEIIDEVEKIEASAIMRVAFVGYRDYCDGPQQHEKVDFVEKVNLETVRSKLAACPATGGGDGPEDVADSPCHGDKYHKPGGDDYPAGDPHGLVPEEFLKVIIKKRIDYYFMKITSYTDIMVSIFQAVFTEAGKEMYIHQISSTAAEFVPKVIKSISASMARSAAFKGIKVTY